MHARHGTTGHLRHVHDALQAGAGGRRAEPRPLHPTDDIGDVARAQPGLRRALRIGVFLGRELAGEIALALLAIGEFRLLARGLRAQRRLRLLLFGGLGLGLGLAGLRLGYLARLGLRLGLGLGLGLSLRLGLCSLAILGGIALVILRRK